MDDKHKKAKEVYAEYQKEEPDDVVYEMVVDEIKESVAIGSKLCDILESLGKNCASHGPKRAVSVLEAIYEALQKESQFISEDKELLFNCSVVAMYNMAQNRFQDTVDILKDCYPDILGEASHTLHQ